MTDVEVVARPNYCRGRQPRLQGCQSELVGAGSKLSSQCFFGLALHIRSLVLCRRRLCWQGPTHTRAHARTSTHIAQVTYMHAVYAHARAFGLAGWVTDRGSDFSAGNKNWHKSRIKFARISLSSVDGIKPFKMDHQRCDRSFETFETGLEANVIGDCRGKCGYPPEGYQEGRAWGAPNLAESEIIKCRIIKYLFLVLSHLK